jgi:transposase
MAKTRTKSSIPSRAEPVITPVGDITGGVDTHLEFHVAAARDSLGRVLGTEKFAATQTGYADLLAWLRAFGPLAVVGVEGTGSYGAGLTGYLTSQGIKVVEVNRPNRQKRRLHGKSDPQDAINAAAAVQAGDATATPKLRTGPIESVRVLRVVRDQLITARTATINALKALIVTAPPTLREPLHGLTVPALIRRCTTLPTLDLPTLDLPTPRPGSKTRAHAATHLTEQLLVTGAEHTVRLALNELARTISYYDTRIRDLDTTLDTLIRRIAPRTTALHGLGPDTTAQLLLTAGDNPHRIHTEAAFARLTGTAPQDASSGKHQHHRLSRAGDRHANAALYRITITRLATHQPTRTYMHQRHKPGTKTTKKHLIRCLNRYITREIYPHLTADLADLTALHTT